MKKNVEFDDVFGMAFQEYHSNGVAPSIKVEINGEEQEPLHVDYFFRTVAEMPEMEQIALDRCRGRILDVGAAAGCHSVALNDRKLNVTSLEISSLSCDVMRMRGLKDVVCADFLAFRPDVSFDTILFLMNGLGMGQTVEGTVNLLKHAKSMLSPGGEIIGDTSDLVYLYDEDFQTKRGLSLQSSFDHYYGKVHFNLQWKHVKTSFDWIYPDPDMLDWCAKQAGLKLELIQEGPHYDYLFALKHYL